MHVPFETLLNGRRNLVFLGEAGCGKSEVALQLASVLAKGGKIDFFDLDQTKPLYRARDARGELESLGIAFHCERQLLDTPTVVGGVEASLADAGRYTLLDVGGNDIGARMIGRFAQRLRGPDSIVLYIINSYRPWAKDGNSVNDTLSAILRASRLREIHLIANPNLGPDTTAEEFLAGLEATRALLSPDVALEGACVCDRLYRQVQDRVNLPLLPIRLQLTYEWAT